MSKFLSYIFCVVTLTNIILPQDSLIQTYNNSALGISFNYNKDIDYPYGFGKNNDPDLSTWKLYISKRKGISFKFPKSLSVKESDSSICLGYYNKNNHSTFYNLVKIYFRKASFNEIAKEKGFELDSINSTVWFMPDDIWSEAQYRKGYNCQVLRGLLSDSFYSAKLGALAIPNLVLISLLVFDSNDLNTIVMYYSNCLIHDLDAIGVPKVDVSENEFYTIASTLEKTK